MSGKWTHEPSLLNDVVVYYSFSFHSAPCTCHTPPTSKLTKTNLMLLWRFFCLKIFLRWLCHKKLILVVKSWLRSGSLLVISRCDRCQWFKGRTRFKSWLDSTYFYLDFTFTSLHYGVVTWWTLSEVRNTGPHPCRPSHLLISGSISLGSNCNLVFPK